MILPSATTPSSEKLDALRDALAATDRLVAPSNFLAETVAAFGVPAESIEQCRNGIRVERFEETELDPDRPLRVGYAGRVTERKGVHLLADAASRVEGAELRVFGAFDPESEDYHARLAELAGDDATFRGWYADRATPYREMDVLVLPSVWYENSPLVIQEAFASGVPVVTGDVGGMAELVRDGRDGLTFPVGDADALADRLGRLAGNPGLVADLREGVTEPKRLRDHAREIADLYADCVGREE
jgi:glycosyltransferase involved in cell wall biosynthesis